MSEAVFCGLIIACLSLILLVSAWHAGGSSDGSSALGCDPDQIDRFDE